MNKKLKRYLEENFLVEKKHRKNIIKSLINVFTTTNEVNEETDLESEINAYLDDNDYETTFQRLLFKHLRDKNIKLDNTNIDKNLIIKIRKDKNFYPSKDEIIRLSLLLELTESETEELLKSASYNLYNNNYYDLIIRFCFIQKIYKIKDVNNLLSSYNCKMFSH